MTFKFCKHASANIKMDIASALSNLIQLHVNHVLLCKHQDKNTMSHEHNIFNT